jgi:hypothetical protein
LSQILLILHFTGLGLAFAGAVGNYVLLLVTNASPPADAATLNRPSRLFDRFWQVGFAMLVVTGPLLLWLKWGGVPAHWTAFWLKMLGVAALAAMIALLARTAGRARRDRDVVAAGRSHLMNRGAATLLILIVVFAVLAFN